MTSSAACQVPLSIGFPRQEYWSGLQFSSPGDLLDPGIKLIFPELAGEFFTAEPPGKSGQSHSHAQFIHSFIILVARMSHILSCFGWLYISIWSK